jgi:hypothetical protein
VGKCSEFRQVDGVFVGISQSIHIRFRGCFLPTKMVCRREKEKKYKVPLSIRNQSVGMRQD